MTTPKDTWISVKDAMPTKDDMNKPLILVVIDSQELVYDCGYKLKKMQFVNIRNFEPIENPTHWMLLSKPKTTPTP